MIKNVYGQKKKKNGSSYDLKIISGSLPSVNLLFEKLILTMILIKKEVFENKYK